MRRSDGNGEGLGWIKLGYVLGYVGGIEKYIEMTETMNKHR